LKKAIFVVQFKGREWEKKHLEYKTYSLTKKPFICAPGLRTDRKLNKLKESF